MDLRARHHASHRRGLATIAQKAPRGRAIELDGVLAAVDPDCPDRSVFNSVAYDHADALLAALHDLAALYDEAGVRAWTVWVAPDDAPRVGPELAAAGHVLDATPELMVAAIAEMQLDRAPPVEVVPVQADAVGELNDLAYGVEPGNMSGAIGRLEGEPFRWFGVREDGRLLSCAGTVEHEGDCWITFVATHPEARGRGLAGAAIATGLREAAARGCSTTSLEATQLGRPAYRRIGYQELGAIEMWERRRPAPPSV